MAPMRGADAASGVEELRLHRRGPHAIQTALRMALFWQQQQEARMRWQGLAASAAMPAAGLTAAATAVVFVAVAATV